MVALGGVMMETEVCLGSARAERDGTVLYGLPEMVISGVPGLMGVTGREWAVYQANTGRVLVTCMGVARGKGVPLWPYLAGLELAPTTAKWGEEKKVRTEESVVIFEDWWKDLV